MNQKATRDQIVETADRLFYQKGFEYTSFADISEVVEISRGNLTFHFKTRDEILRAVIDRRLNRTRQMLEQWEAKGERCEDRIKSFINILITNRTKIMLYGCPVGTLCTELAKLDHSGLAHANKIFELFRDWLGRQFSQLGCEAKADGLAMHLLAWSQGIATLASAFRDEKFVRAEVHELEDWLHSLVANIRPRQNGQPVRRAKKKSKPTPTRCG